jgi:polyhydroxyalkanoate synthesis regulator phasin
VKEIISPSRENTPPLYSVTAEGFHDNENNNVSNENKRIPTQLNSDNVVNHNDINIVVAKPSDNKNDIENKVLEKNNLMIPIKSDTNTDDINKIKESQKIVSLNNDEKLTINDNKPAVISIRRSMTPDNLQASLSLEVDYIPQAKWSVSQEFNVGDLKQSTSRVRRRLVPSTPHTGDNIEQREGRFGTSPTMRGSWDKFGEQITLGQDVKPELYPDDINRKDSQTKVVSIMNLEDHPSNQDSLVFFLRAPVLGQEREVEVEFEFDLNHDDARAILEEMKDCDELADTPVDIEQIMKAFNPLVETAKLLLNEKVPGKSLADAVIIAILRNAKDTSNPSLKTLRERKQHLLAILKRDNSKNNLGSNTVAGNGTPQRNSSREFANDSNVNSPKVLSSSNLSEYNDDYVDDDSLNFEIDESDPLYQEIVNEHNIALSKVDKEYTQRMINVGGAREKMEESHKKELEALADRQEDLKKQLHAMQEKFKERMLDFEEKKQAIIEQARKQAMKSTVI